MNASSRIALALALTAQPAMAAELKITDIKAYLYLEHAGKLSDNIVGAPPFENVAKGGGADHDPATAILFDLTFAGDKNVSPKYATAVVDLTQTGRSGQPITTHRAFTNFIFGADGIEHKAVFLEGATCMPLAIQVHAGKTEKSAKLDFHCTETVAPK